MKTSIAIIIVLLSIPTYADTSQWRFDSCSLMSEEVGPCQYKIKDKIFKVTTNGDIFYTINGRPLTVKIKLPENFFIEKVVFGDTQKNTVLFNFEITDSESGSSIITQINLPRGVVIWQREIPAFNSSPLLIIDKAVYVGGIGYIAKLNLSDGAILWFHDGLYERDTGAYNAFDKPYINGEHVIFPESNSTDARYPGIRSIVVRLADGKMVSK